MTKAELKAKAPLAIGIMAMAALSLAGCAAPVQAQTAQIVQKAPQPAPTRSDTTPPLNLEQAATGWRIAKDHCSACHAIDATSPSPRADAPPLRHVLEIYPPDMLGERFIEGMRVGHDDMPRFDFSVMAADALVAYLKSIRANPSERRPEAKPGS